MKKLTKKQLENQLKYERIYFLIMIVSCFIMMLGMTANFTVMMANNGKMPVKWDINFTDDTHFTYQNESEIPYHYYSDIYNIFNGIFSLGDLLMLFAVTIIIGLAIIGNIGLAIK